MLAIYKSSIRKYHNLMTNDVYNYFLEGKCKVNLRGPGSCALHQAFPFPLHQWMLSGICPHQSSCIMAIQFLWMVLYTEICQRIPSGELIVSTSSIYSQGYSVYKGLGQSSELLVKNYQTTNITTIHLSNKYGSR